MKLADFSLLKYKLLDKKDNNMLVYVRLIIIMPYKIIIMF
jgi:hypothetical protein